MSIASDVLTLLDSLRQAGVRLTLDGDGLVAHGPLSDDLAARVKTSKAGIVAFLRATAPGEPVRTAPIAVCPAQNYEPFPLNETQQAYWLGRDTVFESGQVAIHVFVEMAGETLDLVRAEQAWRRLYAHHDMLRAIVLSDGRQKVLAQPPRWTLPVVDLRADTAEEANQHLRALRDDMSHHCADLRHWPTWRLAGVRCPDGNAVLMLSLDCWAIDGRSMQIVAADFADLYADPDAVLPVTDLTFRDYVLALEQEKQTPAYARSLDYWCDRIRQVAGAPPLPRRESPPQGKPRFVRHDRTLPRDVHATLKRMAAQWGCTLAIVLITCYADVLGRWSGASRFTLNIPRWNRHPLHPDVDTIVGEFATFELLEVDLSTDQSFVDRARALQRRFAADLDHDIVSGMRILREWRKHTGAPPGVGMPYVFTHEPDFGSDGRARAWMASFHRIAPVRHALTQTPQVWIDAQYHDVDGGLLLVWDALDDLFPDHLIADMFDAYAGQVERLGRDAAAWTQDCLIALPDRQVALRHTVNATDAPNTLALFDDALNRNAAQCSWAPAVIDRHGSIDWAGLRRRVAALAERLRAAGATSGAMIAVLMDKGAEQVIAALAVHRIGAVCVPIPTDSPAERLAYMLDNAAVSILVTGTEPVPCLEDGAGVGTRTRLVVDRTEDPAAPCPPLSPAPRTPDDLLAVLYTSGSTGVPKGVMVPVGAVMNVVEDGVPRFGVTPDSRLLSLTPFHHDLSLFDLYAAVSVGACLVLPDPDKRRDPGHWLFLMRTWDVSVWNSVPAMMSMMLDYCEGGTVDPPAVRASLGSLRTVILGGDWVPVETPRRLAGLAPKARLWSIGGPTETTIWNITYRVRDVPEDWPSIPYGTPTRNNRYYILNDRLEDCPDWTCGELCCAGAGLAAGYLNDPDRTAAAFITHPGTGERLYRTGDLGRYRPDGLIEFVGRRDTQINLNGFRMELGEIEAGLARHPAVQQAIAVPRLDGRVVRSVVAWVILKPGQTAREEDLLAFVTESLPPQMCPAAIWIRPAMPLTGNGKVDRQLLQAEATEVGTSAGGFVPSTEAEARVAEAWRTVLGTDPAGPDESFFAAGGDSIAAIALYNALLAGCVEGATVLTVFRASTPRALARVIEEAAVVEGTALPPVTPVARDRASYPATAAQMRMWIEERLGGAGRSAEDRGGAAYNLAFNLQLDGEVEATAVRQAFGAVIAAWEPFRTALLEDDDGAPVQVLVPSWCPPLPVDDRADDADSDVALSRIGRDEAAAPFDLAAGKPLRARLVRVSPSRAHLIVVMHHAACDGATLTMFLTALASALQGQGIPAPAITPVDYAHWERLPAVEAEIARQVAWWRSRLADLPRATGLPVPGGVRPDRSAEAALREHALSVDLSHRVAALARANATTPYVVLMTALTLVLRRWTGEDRVVLGTHVSLRDRPEVAAVPGMMVNTVVLDLDLTAVVTVKDALEVGRAVFLEAWNHSLAPFNRVVQAMERRHDPIHAPLYNITFTHENIDTRSVDAGTLRISTAPPFVARTPVQLDMALAESTDGAFTFKAVFAMAAMDDAMVAGLFEALETLLDDACDQPERPIAAIPATRQSPEELLESGCGPRRPVDPDDAPTSRFLGHVQGWPTAPALLSADGSVALTFGDLEIQVRCAAAVFRSKGLRAGGTVAIVLPRGSDLVVAMLAAWWCGARFVALSPDQPAQRMAFILEDARPDLVVSGSPPAVPIGAVCAPADWSGAEPARGAPASADPVAALVYTSGSTGRPNGVLCARRALMNRLRWQWETWPFTEGERAIARTPVEFVDYLAELFAPLLAGHPVAVIDAESGRDPERLATAVAAIAPGRVLAVPSLLNLLLDETGGDAPLGRMDTVRMWVVSGEPLAQETVRSFFSKVRGARLINIYGSSETGADVTWAEQAPDANTVAIGVPVSNLEVHVVSETLAPMPAGMPGQLLVAGEGLAQGYHDRSDLTAARFIDWQGRRGFLTGDRGLRLANGALVLLGRLDRQVKIRGQRVELDDVQAVLCSIDGLREAAVVLDMVGGSPSLVAAVVGRTSRAAIMATLRAHLPEAAVPVRIACVPALPRTSGGKIAYAAIADLVHAEVQDEDPRVDSAEGQTPLTPVQAIVAGLWQEVIGCRPARPDALFMDLGGHSIAAARLAARIRRDCGVAVSIRRLIEAGSLAGMAAAIEETMADEDGREGLFESFSI